MPNLALNGQQELEYFNRQMESYQKIAWELVLFDSSEATAALEEAARLIGEFVEREKLDAIFLNHTYEKCQDSLLQGLSAASADDQELYATALSNLARAFLEVVAFAGPEAWGPYTRFTLMATKKLFRESEKLDFDAILNQWLSQLEKEETAIQQMRSSLFL